MKTIDYSEKAIRGVDLDLKEGDYSYPFFCYVPWDYWDDLLLCDAIGLIGENATEVIFLGIIGMICCFAIR